MVKNQDRQIHMVKLNTHNSIILLILTAKARHSGKHAYLLFVRLTDLYVMTLCYWLAPSYFCFCVLSYFPDLSDDFVECNMDVPPQPGSVQR